MIILIKNIYFSFKFLKIRANTMGTNVRDNFHRTLSSSNLNKDGPKEEDSVFRLEEKSAIVNGGASGIGLGIVREFLKRGMPNLTIIDIHAEKGEDVENQLCKEFGHDKVQFFEADVTNAKELDAAYRKAIHYNDIPDIVVNSAGVMNDTNWEMQLQTNLAGCVITSLVSMQYMSKASKGFGGTIVNIASIFGVAPSSGYPLHSMTQFGVCGFSRALGCGNHIDRTGVKVFTLCAGLTETQLLKEAPKLAINDNFAQEYLEEIKELKTQKVDSVAKGLADIIGIAKQGSVWVVENDKKPYEIYYSKIISVEEEKEAEEETENQNSKTDFTNISV